MESVGPLEPTCTATSSLAVSWPSLAVSRST
jgi:hypothetical protein